jgi:hypothetical protein
MACCTAWGSCVLLRRDATVKIIVSKEEVELHIKRPRVS